MLAGRFSSLSGASRIVPTLTFGDKLILTDFVRSLSYFEYFSKEKVKERRERLKDEFRKGRFGDFKSFAETGGKIFEAPKDLIPESIANGFPESKFLLPDRSQVVFPDLEQANPPPARFACFSMREAAKGHLLSWINAFGKHFEGEESASLYRMSVINSAFGSGQELKDVLGMKNELTAYAFLVDRKGLVRWRACGKGTEEEIETLIKCTRKLIDGN